jgi:hypothetical protein
VSVPSTYVPPHLHLRPAGLGPGPRPRRWPRRLAVAASLVLAIAAGMGFSEWVGWVSGSAGGTEAVTTDDTGDASPVTTRPAPATTAPAPPTTGVPSATTTPAPPSAALVENHSVPPP